MSGPSPPRFGRPRLHLRETGSTNDVARRLAEAGAPDGALVSCDRQTAGRGRRGRGWVTPPGAALLASFVMRRVEAAPALLALAVPLAVCEAIDAAGEGAAPAQVKWPNDVWLDGRKVAGILIEARPPQWALLGIGVNVARPPDPEELRWPPAASGGTVETLLEALCPALDRWCGAAEQRILSGFAERDALRGLEVGWRRDGAAAGGGIAAGVDSEGRLVVELEGGGSDALAAGEVSVRPAPETRRP